MRSRLRPTSTLGRAVLPVLGGLAFFALLGLTTWGVAALLSDNPERVSDRLAATTFEPGGTEFLAGLIAEDGPLLFQGLVGTEGEGSIVLDHVGDDPAVGWRLYYAHPADRDESCKVTQVKATRQFTDCDGRTLDVTELAPPPDGVRPIIGDTVIIDLRAATTTPADGTSAPATTSE